MPLSVKPKEEKSWYDQEELVIFITARTRHASLSKVAAGRDLGGGVVV